MLAPLWCEDLSIKVRLFTLIFNLLRNDYCMTYKENLLVRLRVKVVPGASQSEVSGWLGDTLKIRVTAQPEKGKANVAVVLVLATSLGLPEKSVSVLSGKTSQHKVVEIQGLSNDQVRHKLNHMDF